MGALVKPLHRYDQGSSYPGRPPCGGHRGHGGPPSHRGSLCLASSLCWMAGCPCSLAAALCWLARRSRLELLAAHLRPSLLCGTRLLVTALVLVCFSTVLVALT